jgi:hypothetical protein
MSHSNNHGETNCQTCQEKIYSPAHQKLQKQRIGERDQQTCHDSYSRQAAQPIRRSEYQLTAVLEPDEGSAWPSEREGVGPNDAAMLDHVAAVIQVAGEVSI